MYQTFVILGYQYLVWCSHKIRGLHKNDFITATKTVDFETGTFTKVVALTMQMLDRKPNEEPVMTVEEEVVDYEA